MKRKLIFAGNHDQVKQYASEQNLSPRDYIEVSSLNNVIGLSPDEWEVVVLGNWWENEDVSKTYAYLRNHPRWHAIVGHSSGEP